MGIFSKKQEPFSEETLRASVFMTIAQALNVGKQTPASDSIPEYSKLFSAIVAKTLKDGLISEEIFQSLLYSPFQIALSREDYDNFKIEESDAMKYLQQLIALSNALSPWDKSMAVSNEDQMKIFTALAMECEKMGMDKNDEETMGLLFIVSLFYTTMLKDSQADRVNCERWRSVGSFFATELPNRWLLEKAKG